MTAANLEALGSFFFFLATCGESLLLSLLLLVVQLHVLGLFGIVPLVPWRGWGEVYACVCVCVYAHMCVPAFGLFLSY